MRVDFFRSAVNDSALEAATRFKSFLRLQERNYDIWTICALSGSIDILDVAAIASADIEPRVRVTFTIYANIAEPEPLQDKELGHIDQQLLEVTHVGQDEEETIFEEDIINPA